MSKYKLPVVAPQHPSIDDLLLVASSIESELDVLLTDRKIEFSDNRPAPPTVLKETVSYSELATWMECAHRHKLKYIDQVGTDGPTEHTEFGQVIHDTLEQYLATRVMPSLDQVSQQLDEHFAQLPGVANLKRKDWHDQIEPILQEVPGFLDQTFPGWEFIASEHELLEPIEGHTRRFRGFIDGVIRVPKKRQPKNAPVVAYDYVLLDWKTTSWGWALEKKIDPKKTMQLALYKYFYATKFKLNMSELKCFFVLLKRAGKKERCELVTVSVGEKAIEKALATIDQMLGYLKKGFFPKNRDSCKFCIYRNTEYCP